MADDPQTPEQWQYLVNLAELCLCIDAARGYGLLTGGPRVNSARCRSVLLEGARRGIQPQQVQVDALLKDMAVVDAFARLRDE